MDGIAGSADAGPLAAYRARVAAGGLRADPAQAAAAERLQELWFKLRRYDPGSSTGERGRLARLFRRRPTEGADDAHPHGLYLVGEVGRGKSMLMDLFFEAAQVPRRRRIHFHAFMQEVHAQFYGGSGRGGDPVPGVADAIAAEAALLCFDEFQVNDIADAMVLGRLFDALFARGVVVVATSNTLPDDLFRGRPGRDAFLPFIATLKRHLDVLVLDGGTDWRRGRMRGHDTWLVPPDGRAEAALDAAFVQLADGAAPGTRRLSVMGRSLMVPLAAGRVARFDFEALCGQPLGPGDYLALATHFDALVLDGVPRLGPDNYDLARRFIVLIDALYDHRVKLFASAEALPDSLYREGRGADAFERTASRLEEMRSDAYRAAPHLT